MVKSRKILVVDDDPDTLDLVSLTLTTAGYEVDTALDGNIALKLIEMEPPALVLLDIMMPGPSGLEVLKRMRDRSREAPPVVLFTARNRPQDQQDGLKLGAASFLLKPIARGRLLDVVHDVLEKPSDNHASD